MASPQSGPLDASPSPGGRNMAVMGPLAPFKHLWFYMSPYRATLSLAVAALLLAGAAGLALPIGVRLVIDSGLAARSLTERDLASIDMHFLLFFAIAALLAIFAALRFYLVSWLGERVITDIRRAIYEHVVTLSPTFFELHRTGELLSRITSDTTLVQATAGVNLSITLRSAVMLLAGLIMLAFTSLHLTAIIVLLIPGVLVPLLVYGRRVRRLTRDAQDKMADASALAGETLGAIQVVQAFTLESHVTERFGDTITVAFRTAVQRIRARAALTAFAILVLFGAIVFVLWLGTHAVLEGTMSAGELGQFLLYSVMVGGAAASLSEMWGEIQRAGGALERIVELLNARPDVVTPTEPLPLPSPARGELRFGSIRFSYPSRPEELALRDFNLTVEPGESIALVGPSGAGKSTVFQLLLRFYDPASGCIRFDGIDIARCDPAALRRRIGIVPQESFVFADTVTENIRQGAPGASDEEVRRAARAAGVDAFARSLPDSYDTQLGERGTRLSGGQRQRIAIARAFLKNPAVMLLDEATSSLDAESERLVQQALVELMRDRTTIVIAHRLATVLEVDRIVVMDQGRVVADGTHAELIRTNPLYAHLAALQFDTRDKPDHRATS